MNKSTSLSETLDLIESDARQARAAIRDAISGAAVPDVLRTWMQHLRADVEIADADLNAALASDRAALLKASRSQVDSWHAKLDQLRVQAALADMEARDDVQEALATAEKARSAAEQHLDNAAADAAATLDGIREGTKQSMKELVAAARSAIGVVEGHVHTG